MIKPDHVLIHAAILVGIAILLYHAFFSNSSISLVTNI